MRTLTRLTAAALCLSLCLLAAPRSSEAGILDWSVGVKGAGGVEIWTSPTDVPFGIPPFFHEERAGWSAGAGIYGELRILKFLAIEIDLLFIHQVLMEDTTHYSARGSAKTEEEVRWTTLRIPILVKGVLPLGIVRLWVGIGPEFTVTLDSSASIKLPKGVTTGYSLKAREVNDIYLTTALGIVISVGPIAIPIELRFGYNLQKPDRYADLVSAAGTRVSIRAANSMEARLLVGVGYEF